MEQDTHHHTGVDLIGTNLTTIGFLSQSNNWLHNLGRAYPAIFAAFSYILIAIGSFGVVGNILVIMVYVRMGFSNTVHVSYTALAVTGLLCSLASLVKGIIPLMTMLQQIDPELSRQLDRMLGSYPNYAFSKIAFLIMAWISFERCLCVMFPTRVKILINSLVTKIALATSFILGVVPLAFLYFSYRYQLQFDSSRNTTSLVLVYDSGIGQSALQQFGAFLLGIVYPIASCGIVTLSTAILVIKLKQSAKWRQLNASGDSAHTSIIKKTTTTVTMTNESEKKNHVMSTKEARITRVVVIVASVFLLCSLPIGAQILALATVPGYSSSGPLRHLNRVNVMVAFIVTQLNSSLNIVVFTASMERFRSNLIQILTGQCSAKRVTKD